MISVCSELVFPINKFSCYQLQNKYFCQKDVELIHLLIIVLLLMQWPKRLVESILLRLASEASSISRYDDQNEMRTLIGLATILVLFVGRLVKPVHLYLDQIMEVFMYPARFLLCPVYNHFPHDYIIIILSFSLYDCLWGKLDIKNYL